MFINDARPSGFSLKLEKVLHCWRCGPHCTLANPYPSLKALIDINTDVSERVVRQNVDICGVVGDVVGTGLSAHGDGSCCLEFERTKNWGSSELFWLPFSFRELHALCTLHCSSCDAMGKADKRALLRCRRVEWDLPCCSDMHKPIMIHPKHCGTC